MANSNPAFANSPAFRQQRGSQAPTLSAQQLDELYQRPSATPVETDRMTYDDTIRKTVIAFAVLLGGAVIGVFAPVLTLPAGLVGFVLALVNIFKKKPSPALILAYSGVQGVFIGGISVTMERIYEGIVSQAVIGTLAVVGVTLALFASGRIRASKRATKIFIIVMVAYGVFSLINVGMMLFGLTDQPFGLRSELIPFIGLPWGVVLGALAILLGAYSLVLDFDSIQQGVRNGAPRIFGWSGAFGIMVTVIWLYVEILRLLAILRGSSN